MQHVLLEYCQHMIITSDMFMAVLELDKSVQSHAFAHVKSVFWQVHLKRWL